MDKHNWTYTAIGETMLGANKKTITVTSSGWYPLKKKMAEASREVMQIQLNGKSHNSYQLKGGPFFEEYIEDLEFPKVTWKVTRSLAR